MLKSKLKGSFTYEAKDAYFKAWKKTKIVAIHMGKSEATHFNIVEFYGCLKCFVFFVVLNISWLQFLESLKVS